MRRPVRWVLLFFSMPSIVAAFDWGDFHKVAVIFFSFFGPMLILSAIAAAAYFGCIKSWYERFRDDVHETHRSFHPWPPGSAKWQLQQFINSTRGLPSKILQPVPGEPPPGSRPPLIPTSEKTPLAAVAGAPYVGLLGAAPQYSVACLPSPQTTYTVAVDPRNKEQVPYTTVIKPKQEQAVPIETIFSASPAQKASMAPSVTIIPPDQPAMHSPSQMPISVITDSSFYPRNYDDREPIIRSPVGGNVLYSQGHDWTQLEPTNYGTYPRSYAPQNTHVYPAGSQAPSLLSPHRLHDSLYRVQTPSPNYQQPSPNDQMQAIFVRTTTTTHRTTTLSPRRGYTVV